MGRCRGQDIGRAKPAHGLMGDRESDCLRSGTQRAIGFPGNLGNFAAHGLIQVRERDVTILVIDKLRQYGA